MADGLHAEGKKNHAIEKILARASGRRSVSTGQIVNCRIDLAEVNDLYPQTIFSFHEMGGKKVHLPDRLTFILDHYAPAFSIHQAENQKLMREFCRDQGIELLFDVDSGVCHPVMVDHGLVYPGMILIATDSHTTIHGVFGAFGTGVGAMDLAVVMATGHLWLRVPEIIRINLSGKLSVGVFAKDVILAESFARIFYRNAINIGLPLFVSPNISDRVSSGDSLKIDLEKGLVLNKTTGEDLKVQPMSGYVLEILITVPIICR